MPASRTLSQAGALAARLGDLLGLPGEEIALLRSLGGDGAEPERLSPDVPSAALVAQVVDAYLHLEQQHRMDPWTAVQALQQDERLNRRLVNRFAAMLFEPAF